MYVHPALIFLPLWRLLSASAHYFNPITSPPPPQCPLRLINATCELYVPGCTDTNANCIGRVKCYQSSPLCTVRFFCLGSPSAPLPLGRPSCWQLKRGLIAAAVPMSCTHLSSSVLPFTPHTNPQTYEGLDCFYDGRSPNWKVRLWGTAGLPLK